MPRGSKPGERRGGRKPGSINKTTKEIKDLARKFGHDAIERAASLAGLKSGGKAESESAQIAALNILLDRGYGRPPQAITGDPESPLEIRNRIEIAIVDPKN